MRSGSVSAVPSGRMRTARAIHSLCGTACSSVSPSAVTTAASHTTAPMRSGTFSATRGMITPPMLWPTRTTSCRSSNSITFTMSVTNVSKVTATSRCDRSPKRVSVGVYTS